MASMIVRESHREAPAHGGGHPLEANRQQLAPRGGRHQPVHAPEVERQARLLEEAPRPQGPLQHPRLGRPPPTAIGNGPAIAGAAAAPVSSPYWYYLHDADGVLHRSRSVDEAYRRKYNVY